MDSMIYMAWYKFSIDDQSHEFIFFTRFVKIPTVSSGIVSKFIWESPPRTFALSTGMSPYLESPTKPHSVGNKILGLGTDCKRLASEQSKTCDEKRLITMRVSGKESMYQRITSHLRPWKTAHEQERAFM